MPFSGIVILSAMVLQVQAGLSYQSVRFVNNNFQPVKESHTQFKSSAFPLHQYVSSLSDDVIRWPPGVFDVTLDTDHFRTPDHAKLLQADDLRNDLDLLPDPELLTGFRAKQAAEYIYGRGALFFKNIPHAHLVSKLQARRHANGLRPNRLGSINPNSPFYREMINVYSVF